MPTGEREEYRERLVIFISNLQYLSNSLNCLFEKAILCLDDSGKWLFLHLEKWGWRGWDDLGMAGRSSLNFQDVFGSLVQSWNDQQRRSAPWLFLWHHRFFLVLRCNNITIDTSYHYASSFKVPVNLGERVSLFEPSSSYISCMEAFCHLLFSHGVSDTLRSSACAMEWVYQNTTFLSPSPVPHDCAVFALAAQPYRRPVINTPR